MMKRVRVRVCVCVWYRHPAVSMLSSAANGTSILISLIEALDPKIDIRLMFVEFTCKN